MAVVEGGNICLFILFSENLRRIKIKSTIDWLITIEMEF